MRTMVAIFSAGSAAVSLPVAAAGDQGPGVVVGSMAGLVAVFFLVVLWLLLRGWHKRRGFIVALAALGAAVGLGIGLSPEPVIGTVVPLLVALLGVGFMGAPSVSPVTRGAWVRGAAGFCLLLQLTAWLGCCLRLNRVWYSHTPTLVAMCVLFAGIATVAWAARSYWRRVPGTWPDEASVEDRTWLLVAAAAAGAFAGLATAMSATPVVEYVVPALLSLFGLLSVFLFTEGKSARLWLGAALVGFGLLLVLGQYLGESLRVGYRWEDAGPSAFSLSVLYAMVGGAAALLGAVGEDRVNSVGFAAMGAGTGLAIGLSASPLGSAIVPAILTAAGGVAAYFGAARKKGQRLLYVFAGTFALLLLLGGYAGWTLHDGGAGIRADSDGLGASPGLRAKIEAIQADVSALEVATRTSEGKAIASATFGRIHASIADVLGALASAPAADEDDGSIDRTRAYLWFEGSAQSCAVAIACNRVLSAPLRVDELVDEVCLFSGTLTAGMGVCLFGEAFEVSWRRSDGPDAVTVLFWERMVRTSNGWGVEGQGTPVDASTAEVRGDRYVLSIL